MATGDLTSAAAVKAWAKIQGSTADDQLATLVTAASAWIGIVTSRDFSAGTKTKSEIRHGTGGTELFLAEPPVSGITSLTVNSLPIPAQPADGQPGYFLVDGQVLALCGYRYCRGRNNVRVSYTYGFTSVPVDVAQACIELVADTYLRGQRGPALQSQTLSAGGETMSWKLDDVPAGVRTILNNRSAVVPV